MMEQFDSMNVPAHFQFYCSVGLLDWIFIALLALSNEGIFLFFATFSCTSAFSFFCYVPLEPFESIFVGTTGVLTVFLRIVLKGIYMEH